MSYAEEAKMVDVLIPFRTGLKFEQS
ncbi:hypothetical protein THIOKS1330001 [Thiocapsa sp. KS1]|nr:hypothetical protein THIOKS1330001 [Thiocapsa sp. KS1]